MNEHGLQRDVSSSKERVRHIGPNIASVFLGSNSPIRALDHPIVEVPRSHTTRHRHPVELLSTNDDLVAEAAIYTTHNKHKRRTSITLAVFEPAIPTVRRLDTYALGATTTEIGSFARYF